METTKPAPAYLDHDLLLNVSRIYSADLCRSYHTFEHISQMLAILDKKNILLTEAQKLAILFHDIVYIPTAKDNELNSAIYMRNFISLKAPQYIKSLPVAEKIILATVNHSLPENCEEAAVVLDADLYRLAGTYDSFLMYGLQVFDEYKVACNHDIEIFNHHRSEFFKKLMQKEKLFNTVEFLKEEVEARNNITTFINSHSKIQ